MSTQSVTIELLVDRLNDDLDTLLVKFRFATITHNSLMADIDVTPDGPGRDSLIARANRIERELAALSKEMVSVNVRIMSLQQSRDAA